VKANLRNLLETQNPDVDGMETMRLIQCEWHQKESIREFNTRFYALAEIDRKFCEDDLVDLWMAKLPSSLKVSLRQMKLMKQFTTLREAQNAR